MMGMMQSLFTKTSKKNTGSEFVEMKNLSYKPSSVEEPESDELDLDSYHIVDVYKHMPIIREKSPKRLEEKKNKVTPKPSPKPSPKPAPQKSWKENLSKRIRNFNVIMLVEAFKPTDLHLSLRSLLEIENDAHKNILDAKRLEQEILDMAESKVEYLNKVYVKIHQIKTDLASARQERKFREGLY